jgi:hypothetical protein
MTASSDRPYADAAWSSRNAGWPNQIPLRGKFPPVAGYTGRAGLDVSGADIQAWIDGPEGSWNIAQRMPEWLIGIDVDHYGEKTGADTLAALEEKLGPLPATWRSTARGADNPSGIRYFRVPEGRRWVTELGSIEIIQRSHRYAVHPPSINPKTGTRYELIDADGNVAGEDEIPDPRSFPMLPDAWIEYLDRGEHVETDAALPEDIADLVAQVGGDGEPCTHVTGVIAERYTDPVAQGHGRHDSMIKAVHRLVTLAREGHGGVLTVLAELRGKFEADVAGEPGHDDHEFVRSLDGAVNDLAGVAPSTRCLDTVVGALSERPTPEPAQRKRRLKVRTAADIEPRRTHWLWTDRLGRGALTLLAGREGIGKSTLAYQLAADLSRGRLQGELFGQPKGVIIVATEDSWEHIIVPRLIAAGADLTRIHQVSVSAAAGFDAEISLPDDIEALSETITELDVALVLLDPLMSRLDGKLDPHKDPEVRRALEPVVMMADRTGATVLGLIHLSKASTSDPLTAIMGSRAFVAVARAVLTVMLDPEDDQVRLVGVTKSNHSPGTLATLSYTIETAHNVSVDPTDGTAIHSSRLVWGEQRTESIRDLMEQADEPEEHRSAVDEAGQWLYEFLTGQGGTALVKDIDAAGKGAGYKMHLLKRARKRVGVSSATVPGAWPRQSQWSLRGVTPLDVEPL